jgi:diguanylate cyclase (GGDEF)-like protein
VLNKSSIARVLKEELAKRKRYRKELSVILLDLDNFKNLNDTAGHLAGDRALQIMGKVLQRNIRKHDKAGRMGGDEFLVVLPETGVKGATTLAQRIRIDLQKSLSREFAAAGLSASIGIANCTQDEESENLLERADLALYRAKADGKNRIAGHPPKLKKEMQG